MLLLPDFFRLPPGLFRAGKRRRIRRRRQPTLQKLTAGVELLYLGQPQRLVLVQTAVVAGCRQQGDQLIVTLPPGLTAAAQAEEIRIELRLWYKKQARVYIKTRLDYWASILGVTYNRCLITGPISLWGSCNAVDDIRINWRIMMAPESLIDYLLAHELCHVAHKNHSRQFWDLLTSVMPDCKARRQTLRTLGPRLFAQQG